MSRIFKEFDHLELWEIMINISENIEIYKFYVGTCKYNKKASYVFKYNFI